MTLFAISCKFFFQILAYLEEKKNVQPLWLLHQYSTALFKDSLGMHISYYDSSADTANVCFPASLRHTNVLKQISTLHSVVCVSIQKLYTMSCSRGSSCKDNTDATIYSKLVTSHYLKFREFLVTVLVYLNKCFNTARSLIYCIKFNLKDQCCIGWNLALCYEQKKKKAFKKSDTMARDHTYDKFTHKAPYFFITKDCVNIQIKL